MHEFYDSNAGGEQVIIETPICRAIEIRRPSVKCPRFCISIPTYRRADVLSEAISSALNQNTTEEYIVIVVDNCGDSATRDLISSIGDLRLGYYINLENIGMTANWNQCVALSRAPWVTILHDDDALFPGFLKRATVAIYKFRADFYFCASVSGSRIKAPDNKASRFLVAEASSLVFGNISSFPGVIFSKSKFQQAGGFRIEAYPCADYDLWFRLCKDSYSISDSAVLAFYRVNENQGSASEFRRVVKCSHRLKYRIAMYHGAPNWLARCLAKASSARLLVGYKRKYAPHERLSAKIRFSSRFLYPLLRRFWSVLARLLNANSAVPSSPV